ncbi:MAG TPA: polymer-forming cytoskeletal protein, partial [Gemmatimonadales bacterium]|nr:polymer-forming cytoskeletal protein [Gemmatimonadales bacterium]
MRAGAMLLAILALSPPRAAAQDTVQVRPRGRAPFGGSTHERAVNLFNDRGTTRMFGDQTIDRRTTIRTDAGVYRGRLEVYGTIDGNLVAVNADVSIYAEAEVRGDVLVVGGTLFVSRRAQVEGSTEEYPDAIGVRERDGMLELTGTRPQRRARDYRLRRSFGQSRATIALTTGGTYNRVEGLPILVGPRLTWTDRSAALRLEGLGVFRTANGLEPDLDNRDMGYAALADLRLGAGREVQLGGRAFDLVQPVEDWQLRADEVGLASLLWHRDFRDYYLSRGLAGFLRLHPTAEITLSGELIRSEASSVAARDPWTLFRNAEPWRPNPLVDEGRFTQVRAALDLDSRPARRWNTGLRLHAEWEHGRSDSLNPRTLPLVRAALPLTDYRYDRVFADLRLFQPMGFGGLQLRAVGGASVGRDDLPIQRRFSLGGPDPMPGFPFRHLA